jgi:hypothetical protein
MAHGWLLDGWKDAWLGLRGFPCRRELLARASINGTSHKCDVRNPLSRAFLPCFLFSRPVEQKWGRHYPAVELMVE